MKQVHIIVDMLNDFITGSLACNNAEEAVKQTVDYINKHKDMDVFYICDSHPKTHCSFTENGGTWPNHCVKGSFGGEIHELFYSVEKKSNKPQGNNSFRKGENPKKEEYSGYYAKNSDGVELGDFLKNNNIKDVIISGIATEFCVKETAMDFFKNNFNVVILEKNLAYVNEQNHIKTLKELSENIKIV